MRTTLVERTGEPRQEGNFNKVNEPLAKLEEVFGKHYQVDGHTPLKVTLGTVVANRGEGDPVWLILVGPPSSLKTELIHPLSGLEDVHPISLLTPRTLASGDTSVKKAGLLERLPDKTILTLKDFGSVLTMRRDDRAEVLAALREIYDGSYHKDFGNGKRVEWKGKLGLIAGCTGMIDTHHTVNQVLGERFLMCRLESCDRDSVTRKALENAGREKEIRQEVSDAVGTFMKTVEQVPGWSLGEVYTDKLAALANFTAMARTGVLRNGRTREVEVMPDWEGPARLAKQLSRLAYGLSCLTKESSLSQNNYKIIFSVAENSLPKVRREVLTCLVNNCGKGKVVEVAKELDVPQIMVRRTLEDLEVLKLVAHSKPVYTVTENAENLLTIASP